MSQDFCFYKQKIFSEKVCQTFSYEEVNFSLKALLKKRDLEEEELRNSLFEEVEINSILISAYDKKVEKLLTKSLFLSPQSRFFMVNKKILSAIQSIVESQQKELKKSNGLTDKLSQMSTDYATLMNLFDKKLLFVNLQ